MLFWDYEGEEMVYRSYTMTGKVAPVVMYRCPKCGTFNAFISTNTVSSAYNDKGTFTKAGVESRRENAEEDLRNKIHDLEITIKEEEKRKIYRHVNLKNSCSSCGCRPVWSKQPPSGLNGISIIGLYVLVIEFAVLMLSVSNHHMTFIDAVQKCFIPALIIVIPQIIRFAWWLILEAQVKKAGSYPHLCWTEGDALRIMNELK